jgi:hypothetical protein
VLGSIVENCPIGDAIRRNKASEVHKFGVPLMPRGLEGKTCCDAHFHVDSRYCGGVPVTCVLRQSLIPVSSDLMQHLCHQRIFRLAGRASAPYRVAVLNTRTTSRVIERDIKARSANLVGETKVDCGNLSFSQMCAGAARGWLVPPTEKYSGA